MLKPCRVCAKEFKPCTGYSTAIPGMANWRTFCCSLDCASAYYKDIQESRSATRESKVEPIVEPMNIENVSDSVEEDGKVDQEFRRRKRRR